MTYNADNELTASRETVRAASTYRYDSEGDRVYFNAIERKGDFLYVLDQAGRLDVDFKQGKTTSCYSYDGDGLRMSKAVGRQRLHYVGYGGRNTATTFRWDK